METSLILLKTDTVEKWLIWEVIKMIEWKWLKISGLKMMKLNRQILEKHYHHVVSKDFFPSIIKYMTKTPVIVLAISWNKSIEVIRNLIWITDPWKANPWSIRWTFWHDFNTTVIHASDSVENAKMELKIFFKKDELFEYKTLFENIL
jgi:nucleoside-diphosphate kinase